MVEMIAELDFRRPQILQVAASFNGQRGHSRFETDDRYQSPRVRASADNENTINFALHVSQIPGGFRRTLHALENNSQNQIHPH
jgi:hypothetical protein